MDILWNWISSGLFLWNVAMSVLERNQHVDELDMQNEVTELLRLCGKVWFGLEHLGQGVKSLVVHGKLWSGRNTTYFSREFPANIYKVLMISSQMYDRARADLILDHDDEMRSGTHQDLRMSYAFLQVTQHIYDRNEHSRLLSPSHRHMRSHTHSICSRHALQQVLIFSSIYRLRIAGDYALLMFVTCFDSIPTAGTTLDCVSTVRLSSRLRVRMLSARL